MTVAPKPLPQAYEMARFSGDFDSGAELKAVSHIQPGPYALLVDIHIVVIGTLRNSNGNYPEIFIRCQVDSGC